MAKRTTKAAAPVPVADNVVPMGRAAGVPSFMDGLANIFTGQGGARRAGDVFTFAQLDDVKLQNMYRGDWMSRKGVDIVADDMTQEWRQWNAEPEEIEALEATEGRLGIVVKVRHALRWARMLGGGALIIGDGRNARTPLKVENVQKGGIKWVVAVPRTKLTVVDQINFDMAAENFGLPDYWRLQLGGHTTAEQRQNNTDIHWSRVIVLPGLARPDPFVEADPWGDSVLQGAYDAVRDAGLSQGSGAALIEEARVDILKMDDLASHLGTTETEGLLMRRLQLVALGKSTHKMLLMGGRENYDTKQVNLSNLDRVLTLFLQTVSGAFDIPMTRFLAQSPAGLNSTGESDLRNYATMIKAQQERVLTPALERLDRMLMRDALGDEPGNVWFEWPSIWSMSPKEAAETMNLYGDAATKLANAGLVPSVGVARGVQNYMEESGLFPGMAQAIAEASASELDELRPDPAPIQIDPNIEEAAKHAPPPAAGAAAKPGAKPKAKPKAKKAPAKKAK